MIGDAEERPTCETDTWGTDKTILRAYFWTNWLGNPRES
jgi:hypothetical protein